MAHAKSTDPNVFILPDLGEGLEEAELIAWKVEPGQAVEEHEILAEMETDKALVEVPSPRSGVIDTLHGEPGEVLKVGNPLVTFVGGDAPTGNAEDRGAAKKPSTGAPAGGGEDAGTVVGQVGGALAGLGAGDGKVLAAPAVRRLARDLGIELNGLAGTGIGGRITAKDVRAAASGDRAAPAAPAPAPRPEPRPDTRRPLAAPPSYQPQPVAAPQAYPQPAPMPQQPGYGYPMMMMVPVWPGMMPGGGGLAPAPGYHPAGGARPVPDPAQQSQAAPGQEARAPFRGVRRTIAGRLRESVDTAVHFTVMDDADVTALDDLRRRLAAQSGERISYLPLVAAAACRVLVGRFGALNARVDDQAGEVVQHGSVHLGIATDTDSGLMVPVIGDADRMDVLALARAIADVAASARDRSIARDRLMGSTFTITNVGSHAGKYATPVINYPEVAILAVGRAYDGVVVANGQAAIGKLMPLSLACDHRVVDGATAALALAEIVALLQNPESILAR